MHPRNKYSDAFDQLVADTLRDQMGPAPIHRTWESVRREIGAVPAVVEPPASTAAPSRSWIQWLLQIGFQTPLAKGALTVALFGFILLFQPELEVLWQPASPTPVPAENVLGGHSAVTFSSIRETSFDRLIEVDGRLAVALDEPAAGSSFEPVPDPSQLHTKVRPEQPVRHVMETQGRVVYIPRYRLDGGARR